MSLTFFTTWHNCKFYVLKNINFDYNQQNNVLLRGAKICFFISKRQNMKKYSPFSQLSSEVLIYTK
jgi:hypothetical protein